MSTPGEEPQEQTPPAPSSPPIPGSYGEISPGVPRYGQYAPAGWELPQEVKDAQAGANLPPALAYPGPPVSQSGIASPGGAQLAPPARVRMACRLIVAAGIMQALSVLVLLVVLLVPAAKAPVLDVLQETLAASPELAAVYSDAALLDTILFLGFVLSIVMTASYFLLARAIRKGSNGARTTALVLALFSLLLLGQLNPVAIVQIVLGLVAVFLLYRSPAKEFFLAHKARKGL